MFDRLGYMTDGDKQAVHESALRLLERTGMWFESDAALDLFRQHGHRVDGRTVYFSRQHVENAIRTIPSEFMLEAPLRENRVRIGGNNTAYASSASSTRILDLDGVCRPCTSRDYENALKLFASLDEVDVMFEYVVPEDIPGDIHLLYNLFTQMHIIQKPLSCQMIEGIGLLSIFYGIEPERMRQNASEGLAYGVTMVNPLSPLAMSAHESDKLVACARSGLAVAVAPMSLAGMTAPCTLEGLIVQQNAEILGGLTLTQLASPGAPALYGCLGAITNMRNMMAPVGTPEGRIIEHCASQMAKFYKIPTRSLAGMTDANEVDYQAGAESMLNFVQTARDGINLITGIGSYANWMLASFEKLVLDAECVAYVKRLLRPMDFSAERMAADVIADVGSKGSYITEEHTAEHFRDEFFHSEVFDRQPYNTFIAEGEVTCRERAKRKARAILENFRLPEIDPSLDQKLRQYCAERGLGAYIEGKFRQ